MSKKIIFSAVIVIILALAGAFFYSQNSKHLTSSQTENSINTLPKYGNTVKNSLQLAADKAFIEDTVKVSGSKEAGAARAIKLGWDFFDNNDLDNAMRRFNQAWLLTPNNADVFWGMGSVEGRRGNTDTAIELLSEGLKIDPKNTMIICNLGYSYTNKALDNPQNFSDYLNKSVEQYELANTINPNVAYCHSIWAVSLFYQKKYNEAWQQVHKTQILGGELEPAFLTDLSSKMPDPTKK